MLSPAPSPRVTSSLRLPSCSDCEWSKHELSHTSSPARLGAAEEMMHPADMLRSRRRVRGSAGRQVESWVINEEDLASLKTKEFETCMDSNRFRAEIAV